ncbi:T9SS type A sorting domain-containing protein [Hymenobacter artigasi]|uniref:Pectinesterase n=1 Tax=Hymenobacter artigasi TaxID=2719616 RepID=A0ABX1HLJ1_9BACT|nr:T9SS type A sorting domain-containing protein [Hymenobacter artigasi]NKI90975.1 pectinesterase [Hymenobacter artigasi]
MKNLLLPPFSARVPRIATLGKTALAAALLGLALAGPATAQTAGRAVWSLRVNGQDSVAARSAGLVGSPVALRRLVVSDGNAPSSGTTAPPYSSGFGMAFAPASFGGNWTTALGGPGTSPQRTYYVQFTVTASASTRIDSLLFNAVAASSVGGRVSLQYSRSNFVADSALFTGGIGPAYAAFTSGSTTLPASNGGVLPAGLDGSFTAGTLSPTYGAVLPQYSTALRVNNGKFRFAFNGASGLVLAAGNVLTMRLYFAVNTSTPGRYAFLKDVELKGRAGGLATTPARSATPLTAYPNPVQNRLEIAHPAAPQGARVTVYSLIGQQVATTAVSAGAARTNLEMNALPAGIYMVEYADAQQRITAKVVKQ